MTVLPLGGRFGIVENAGSPRPDERRLERHQFAELVESPGHHRFGRLCHIQRGLRAEDGMRGRIVISTPTTVDVTTTVALAVTERPLPSVIRTVRP